MSEMRIRFAGTGGQGMALAARLFAEAAVATGRSATQSQSYGPESRGGASRADVVVSDAPIAYPIVDEVDVLVALAASARDRYVGDVRAGGVLLADGELPDAVGASLVRWALPLAETARTLVGTGPGANLVALGALVALVDVVPAAAVEAQIAARPPGGSAQRALEAFRAGVRLATGARTVAAKEAIAM